MKYPFALAMLPLLSAAYTVDPPTTTAPDTIEDCTLWAVATATSTCAELIEQGYGLTLDQFNAYNPTQAAGCNLTVGNSYCIEKNWSIPDPTPTPTTSSAAPGPTGPTTDPATLLAICQAQGSYKEYCPRCLDLCKYETTYIEQCFYSIFGFINRYDSECWQHGGHDCANLAVDRVCPK
ncbi:hypothetical protein P171DRAFT_446464 [Karstenula rhodostoma CBS 690.94]|uniref:LysM domain-containing protein n=1 Tax=Karstenula rhodostoma CBS 690.94 TaxID=1392251 RepID=A0A9P4PAU1_9PLEO|nr:hypothetical protein P171DRAFT_446464 [Karstenula rhodostoma CBS 690.94]